MVPQADMLLLNFSFRVERADFVSQETEIVKLEQRKGWRGKEENMKRSSKLKLVLKKIKRQNIISEHLLNRKFKEVFFFFLIVCAL